jgi:hypothetical protein
MTKEEMQNSIAAHDRQLDTVLAMLAPLAERLSSLVRASELQNARLERPEGAK